MKLLTPLQAVSKQTGLKKEPKGIYVKMDYRNVVSQQRGGLNPYEALAGKTFCITCFYVDESSGTVPMKP